MYYLNSVLFSIVEEGIKSEKYVRFLITAENTSGRHLEVFYAIEPYELHVEVLSIVMIAVKDQRVLYCRYLFQDYKVLPA